MSITENNFYENKTDAPYDQQQHYNINNNLLEPIIVLSITQLLQQQEYNNEISSQQYEQIKNEPILCYVYLGDKIQDVRGISRDETRIKLINPQRHNLSNEINIQEQIYSKQLLIQVKQGSSYTIGYAKIPLKLLQKLDNKLKTWVPLNKDRERSSITYEDLINTRQYDSNDRIFIDLRLENNSQPQSYTQSQPQRNTYKITSGRVYQTQKSPIETRQDINMSTYQEISDNITLITGQPYQEESQKIITQSLGQQIFKKKKKTYTQSANPQIQLITQQNNSIGQTKPQTQAILTPQEIEKSLIKEELLQQLPQTIDKIQIKQDLISELDGKIFEIQDITVQKFKELTNKYQDVLQISQNDSKDLIVNDQRQTMITSLSKNTNSLINNRREQENQLQHLQTQVKLQELHGGHQQKRDKLQLLQTLVQQLKTDVQNIQTLPQTQENSIYDQSKIDLQDINSTSSPIENKIYYLKEELMMLLQLSKQRANTKTIQDLVCEEVDKQKDQFISNQQDQNQHQTVLSREKQELDNEQSKLESELSQLKQKHMNNQQIIERQQLEISHLQKHIQAESDTVQKYNKKWNEIIKKQKSSLETQNKQLTQLKDNYTQNNILKQSLQEDLLQEQQKYEDLLAQQESQSGYSLSSSEMQQQSQQIETTLSELKEVLTQNMQAMLQLRETAHKCDSSISKNIIQQSAEETGTRIGQIINDRNELLNTKKLKNSEIESSILSIKHQIEYQNQRQVLNVILSDFYLLFIQFDLKTKIDKLKTNESILTFELDKIKEIDSNFAQTLQESIEKLDIQQNDFQQFETEINQQALNLKDQRTIEQQKLDQLLSIKTKQELEEYLRMKLSEIQLEEQAGKFTEVIKKVHYESQKNDRVENALIRYLNMHPTNIDIKKLGDGYYKYGTRRIYIKLDANDKNTLLVRIAPKEYITLSMFIIENEGIEMQKLGIGKALQQRFN